MSEPIIVKVLFACDDYLLECDGHRDPTHGQFFTDQPHLGRQRIIELQLAPGEAQRIYAMMHVCDCGLPLSGGGCSICDNDE